MDWVGWAALLLPPRWATFAWQCEAGRHDRGTIQETSLAGWWFGTFVFPYIGNSNPNWLIFFRGVETTNQLIISLLPGKCWTSSGASTPESRHLSTMSTLWKTWTGDGIYCGQVPRRDLWVPPQPVTCSSWTAAQCSTTFIKMNKTIHIFCRNIPWIWPT